MNAQDFLNSHLCWVAAIFPIYFLILWLLVALVISITGGWFSLSKTFRTRVQFSGKQWKNQSGQMRWIAGYRSCLTLGANQDGLYLATMFLFRFMHAPLFIPWSEITVRRKTLWLFGEYVTLRLGREAPIPLTIRGGLAKRLRDSTASHWPIEEI